MNNLFTKRSIKKFLRFIIGDCTDKNTRKLINDLAENTAKIYKQAVLDCANGIQMKSREELKKAFDKFGDNSDLSNAVFEFIHGVYQAGYWKGEANGSI